MFTVEDKTNFTSYRGPDRAENFVLFEPNPPSHLLVDHGHPGGKISMPDLMSGLTDSISYRTGDILYASQCMDGCCNGKDHSLWTESLILTMIFL